MPSGVFGLGHRFKVFWAVVGWVTIDVVDNLIGTRLCHNTMLQLPSLVSLNLNPRLALPEPACSNRDILWMLRT
jgi:hypothetical protein